MQYPATLEGTRVYIPSLDEVWHPESCDVRVCVCTCVYMCVGACVYTHTQTISRQMSPEDISTAEPSNVHLLLVLHVCQCFFCNVL